MRVGSLCTGYGGIELGLAAAGETVDLQWVAEVDPALTPLHGEVWNLGDVRAVDWSAVAGIDVLTAGFPCQPVSAAGRQRGDADERWLWPAVWQAVAELQPTRVVLENVRNLVSTQGGRLWSGILTDLEALGYGVRWCTLGACHVGAAHHRHRVFAVATMGGAGVERVATTGCGAKGLLPTPQATDNQGGPRAVAEVRTHRGGKDHGPRLRDVTALLPTPAARDGDTRGEGDARFWAARAEHRTNGRTLGAEVTLLPTPTSSDHTGAGYSGTGGHNLRTSVAWEWGRFAEAVARHEALYGPAPAPTEPNRNGAPRLAPAFAEWLMCLPAGHVTSKLARVPALRAIGNGVCPPQLAAAWGLLTGGER